MNSLKTLDNIHFCHELKLVFVQLYLTKTAIEIHGH